jgi:hypothetical protein
MEDLLKPLGRRFTWFLTKVRIVCEPETYFGGGGKGYSRLGTPLHR